jgi:hypothetical protein
MGTLKQVKSPHLRLIDYVADAAAISPEQEISWLCADAQVEKSRDHQLL